MRFDTEKAETLLKLFKKDKAWLAKVSGVSRPTVYYWFKSGTINACEPVAKAFNMKAVDFVIEDNRN